MVKIDAARVEAVSDLVCIGRVEDRAEECCDRGVYLQ